jgi:hypothetical protein
VFGGDSILTGYWGVAIDLNYGGWPNGNGGGNNSQSYVPGWSAFTVNMRSSTSQTTFDKRLFTIMPDGNVTITNGLNCTGIVNIHNGSRYAVANNYMQSGSLTIGSTNLSYGTSINWTSNTADLLMECEDYTEIAIHDNATRLASFMYYDGPNHRFIIGRDKGWGIPYISLNGNVDFKNGSWLLSGEYSNRFFFC